jgi:hypothetical protein
VTLFYIIVGGLAAWLLLLGLVHGVFRLSDSLDDDELTEEDVARMVAPDGNVEQVPRTIEWDHPPRGGRS